MGSIQSHIERIREHLDEIRDAIDEGIGKKPITIGFHSSACAAELLELYLHQINKIPIGKVIKHSWFKRPTQNQKIEALADRKIGAVFPDKEKIYGLFYTIEENRDNLIYGKPTDKQIDEVLDSFEKLKQTLTEEIAKGGVKIEEN